MINQQIFDWTILKFLVKSRRKIAPASEQTGADYISKLFKIIENQTMSLYISISGFIMSVHSKNKPEDIPCRLGGHLHMI